MTTEKQVEIISSNSLRDFVHQCIAKAKQGWDFLPDGEPEQPFLLYEAAMVRFPTLAEKQADADEAGKPSRADILAKARAAKAEKAGTNV